MTDFSSAAGRHWHDGDHLHSVGRLDNADQLFGFAAECALKAAIVSLQSPTALGELPDHFRKHIDQLWNQVPAQSLSKAYPAISALIKQGNPYSDWHTRQRYDAPGSVALAAVARHRKMAQRLLGAAQILGIRAGS